MLDYTFMQNALMASVLISILCPFVGVFLVLKRHSMIGDALAHSSLAGVAIGLLFGFNPIISAFIFTSICAILIEFLRNYYKKYSDLILVIVLTPFLGFMNSIRSDPRFFFLAKFLTSDEILIIKTIVNNIPSKINNAWTSCENEPESLGTKAVSKVLAWLSWTVANIVSTSLISNGSL